MIRDKLKQKEYFDEYIKKETERLEKRIKKLNSGSVLEERLQLLNGLIFESGLFILIAKYSRGDSIQELVQEYKKVAELWTKSCCLEDVEVTYEENLWFVSMGVLLGVEELDVIRKKIQELNINDWLLNFLLIDSKEQVNQIEGELLVPEKYQNVKDAMSIPDKTLLIHYLEKEWYANCKDYGWYDSHKQRRHRENLYFGYWCFEAGAVVKLLNWDDSDIANQQYYPYELVHYKK